MIKLESRQTSQTKRKKELLTRAALALFRENGFENTTIQDISRASGFSSGSIYNFFGSKIGIVRQLCLTACDGCEEALAVTPEHIAHPLPAIKSAFLLVTRHYEENIGADIIRNARKLREEDLLRPYADKLFSHFEVALLALVQSALQAGTIVSAMEPASIVGYCLSIFYGCVVNWAWDRADAVHPLQHAVASAFDTALGAFSPAEDRQE